MPMIASILGSCALLQLVGAAYAWNEKEGGHTALRGLFGGSLAALGIGPLFLVTAPTRVQGHFHPRYLLSVPILIGIGIGASFIDSGGMPLSILSLAIIATVLGYVVCIVVCNLKFYASIEHKQLDRSFGPPLILVAWIFFLWTALYVQVNRMSSHWLIGILLPLGAWIARVVALFLLSRSCHFQYYVPKATFIEAVANAEASDSEVEAPPPPLLGDVEGITICIVAVTHNSAVYAVGGVPICTRGERRNQ
jgi:hypothetical protein